MVFCTNCGAEVLEDEKFCAACGHKLTREQTAQAASPQNTSSEPVRYQGKVIEDKPVKDRKFKKKRAGLAALLALIVPGLGHIYVGKYVKGVIFLVANIALYILAYSCLAAATGYSATYILGLPVYAEASTNQGMQVMAAIFLLAMLAVWLYQIYDAYRSTKEHNETVEANASKTAA